MRQLCVAVFMLVAACCCFAQEAQQAAMERVRGNATLKWGEARSASQDEAREKAQDDLVAKLKTFLTKEANLTNEQYSEQLTTITVGTLQDIQEILFKEGNEWVCMRYVSESDLKAAEQERKDFIAELAAQGQKQEGLMNISEALKYYTWALRMLQTYQDKVQIKTPQGNQDAMAWLSTHLPAMLSNISFNIPAERIEEDPHEYDRYIVNIEATYDGKPVQTIDVAYFNGEHEAGPVHFKSGEGALMFHDISAMNSVDMRIIFDYATEGRNYSPMLATVYPQKGLKRMSFADRAGSKLPLKVNKEKLEATTSEADVTAAPSTDTPALAGADAAIYTEPRKTKERNFIADAEIYTKAMMAVEEALRTRNYQSVREHFTDEGFRVFELMVGSGTVSVVKRTPAYTVESNGTFTIGKSIPVNIKNGKHTSKENIVFRFDCGTGKIKSVAYALTQRAENDIFRDAQWSDDSRYSLIQFMEDYQTAYALKRLDYIEKIFSDDAIIIVGSVQQSAKKRFFSAEEIPSHSFTSKVNYTTYNKDNYLRKLKEDFRRKSYIQLVFEDTYVSKVATDGVIDNEILWIELKQNYNSSNYSDTGYLALQLNLKPQDSKIQVRTWTPYFVPINNLKKSFPVGIQ